MSMFGGGGQPSGEDILEATKITATAFMEHYNKTVESCYNKCILKYTDSELTVGEMTCVDRCAWKYLEGHSKLRQTINKWEQQMMEQQKNQEAFMKAAGK